MDNGADTGGNRYTATIAAHLTTGAGYLASLAEHSDSFGGTGSEPGVPCGPGLPVQPGHSKRLAHAELRVPRGLRVAEVVESTTLAHGAYHANTTKSTPSLKVTT